MIFSELPLAGAYRIDIQRLDDDRGFFARQFCAQEFAAHGLSVNWLQFNTSFNRLEGTLRGLHFQRPPEAEAKLVRCVKGAVFDVIVDLRFGSDTYGAWTSVELNEDTRAMIYVPPGFAHGFQTLRPNTELFYQHSRAYSPGYEGGLAFDDPNLAIPWPRPVAGLSARDADFPTLDHMDPLK